ncbi:MAG: hypothetical protein M3O15_01965 [Acidobacteriota bacterium]|nr:hypothetical protein [Acidobacteriota bacterium]
MTIWKVVTVVAAGLVVTWPMFLWRHTARIEMGPGEVVLIERPSLWKQVRGNGDADVQFQYRKLVKRAGLFDDLFDGPVLFLPGEAGRTWYCVYDYDVRYDVLVFDLSALPSSRTGDVGQIVAYSEVPVRLANSDEVNQVIHRIADTSGERLLQLSMPSPLPKGAILNRLREAQRRARLLSAMTGSTAAPRVGAAVGQRAFGARHGVGGERLVGGPVAERIDHGGCESATLRINRIGSSNLADGVLRTPPSTPLPPTFPRHGEI